MKTKLASKVKDVAYGNEVKDAVVSVIDHLGQDFTDITVTGEQLWEVYGVLQRKVNQVLKCINELKLPPVKTDILKNTDAGPGVGSSHVEVRYRDAEMARMLNSDRVNIIHTVRDAVARMRQRDRMHVLVKHWLMVAPWNGTHMTHLMD